MSPPWKGRETYCFSPSVSLSVCLSVCLSVTKSCSLYNLITVRDILMKLHTFVKHIQTTCHAQDSAPDSVRFPQIQIELKISMYRIRVCFCLNSTFLPVTRCFHPFRIRRHLIFEQICESFKIIQIQLAGLLIDHILFLPQ